MRPSGPSLRSRRVFACLPVHFSLVTIQLGPTTMGGGAADEGAVDKIHLDADDASVEPNFPLADDFDETDNDSDEEDKDDDLWIDMVDVGGGGSTRAKGHSAVRVVGATAGAAVLALPWAAATLGETMIRRVITRDNDAFAVRASGWTFLSIVYGDVEKCPP